MPRRHTSSAAGALAAALTVAVLAPAAAQDAAGPPLRGSIGAQDATDNSASGAAAPNNLADDSSLMPAPPTPPPPLGGLGDERGEPIPAVPEFGITNAAGLPLIEPPSVDDDLENLPLPPEGHELDPYVPIGMKIGSFLLFTEAEIGTILTDNVLWTRTNPQSDAAIRVAPSVRLESNWSRHLFSASFSADRSWYKDFEVEDDKTYFARLGGRLDVTRRTHLDLGLGKSQTQGGRNSINLTDITGIQTNIQEQHITAGADHTFNRLTLRLEGGVADYNYEDLAGTQFGIIDPAVQAIIPTRDVRDYREDTLTLRGSYELQPQMGVFVEGGISQEVYRQPVGVDGIRRDSSGYE